MFEHFALTTQNPVGEHLDDDFTVAALLDEIGKFGDRLMNGMVLGQAVAKTHVFDGPRRVAGQAQGQATCQYEMLQFHVFPSLVV